MSRCFPYRAPIYKKDDLPVIGSIELQNGWGNSKQRKEQGLYIKEKPNKKRSRDVHDKLDSLEHKSKRRRDDEKRSNFTESCHYERKYDSEHLERSDLSEEHNPPSFLLNQCSSLQSNTKSSQKNVVQNSDPNKKRPGMVLRLKLKLPSKKPEDQELVSSSTGPCSTSHASSSSRIQTVFTDSTQRPNETSLLKHPLSVSDEPCFSGRVVEEPIRLQDGIVEADHRKSRHNSGRHHTPKSERRFRKLMLNWNPPLPQLSETGEAEGLNWLFASRSQSKDGKSSAQISIATISKPSTCSTDTLQPRACYLPEYGMYHLPYVIPF